MARHLKYSYIYFLKEKAEYVLGWTSAIAAYGAFIIPIVFFLVNEVQAGHAEYMRSTDLPYIT